MTFAAWFKTTSLTASQTLVSVLDKDVADHRHELRFAGATAGDPVMYSVSTGSGNQDTVTTTGGSSGVWTHACAVGFTATNRSAFKDGQDEGTGTTNRTPLNLDRLSIGLLARVTTPLFPMVGRIAEVAVWDVALSDTEVLELAGGVPPTAVQSADLVAYWPLVSDAEDAIGSNDLTVNGAVLDADHPPLGALRHPNYREFPKSKLRTPTTVAP